jgi:riboflavin transporter FmnP
MKTRKIVIIGMLSSFAFLLQVLGSIMSLKVAGFLEIEFSDLPAVIGTLAYGPMVGLIIEFIKNLLHTTITSTGFVGEFANFVMNGMYVLAIGAFYKFNKTKKGAYISLLLGVLAMAIGGAIANLYIMLPLYMSSAPFSVKLNLVLYTITPFNIVKGIVIGLITMIIYKRISPLIKGR